MTDQTYTDVQTSDVAQFFNYIYNNMIKLIGTSAVVSVLIAMLFEPAMIASIGIISILAFLVLAFWKLRNDKILEMEPSQSMKWLYVFSVVVGGMLGATVSVYPSDALSMAFIGAIVTFSTASLYGRVTGKNLEGWGPYLSVALISLLIVMIIDLILVIFFGMNFGWLDYLISIAGIVIFTLLTAFETQTLKTQFIEMGGLNNPETKKLAMVGTISLYLTFLNIFMMFTRLLGMNSSDN